MADVRPLGVNWRISLVVALSMILGYATTLQAQAEIVKTINLDQAIQMALRHDYEVKAGQNDLDKANLVIREKVIGTLPQVTLGAQDRNDLSKGNNSQNVSLTVQQTIPGSLQLYGEKTASEREIAVWDQQTSEDQYRILRAEVIYNTISLYLNAIKAEHWVTYYQTAVGNAQASAEQAKVQLGLGKVTKVTQLTTEHDLAKARYELASKQQDYQVALKKLGQQLGATDYRSLKLDGKIASGTIDIGDYSKLHTLALTKRLELHQKQVAIKNAEQELAQAVNGRLPSLSLGYQNRNQEQSYNMEYDFLNAEFSWVAAWQDSYLDDIDRSSNDDTFGYSKELIKLEVSWSLDFGSAKNKAQQAAYTLENAKLEHLQLAQDITAEVDAAISQYELAVDKVTLCEQAIPLYQKELELQQLKSKLGTTTPVDLATAELNLLNAQVTVEDTNYDLRLATENLRLKLGELYN